MGKAKAKDEKKDVMITTAEMLEREKKYQQRLQDIAVSCNFVKESSEEFSRLDMERVLKHHWEHFLRCDGLPRPYVPSEMRMFLAKLQHRQQFETDHTIDWTLSVDERTILTQNIFRVDCTRRTMKEVLHYPIGNLFQHDLYMYLDTLGKIDALLDNITEMKNIDQNRQYEIFEVRAEIEKEIDACFDRLTYRILRMDGVFLNTEDDMVATWSHVCDRYVMDIWTLRDISIRFVEIPSQVIVANLNNVGIRVQMPLSVLHDCLVLRCIHMNFDTYSQYAKSFDLAFPEFSSNVSSGIQDIEECLVNEWFMQVDIQEEMLENMLSRRAEYEEIMRIIAERIDKANKEAKSGDSKGPKIVIPKAPKEPPAVPPDMVPDPFNIFLERESQQYSDLLEEVFNPHNLKLKPFEVNMRENIILGGLYSLMFIRRPKNTHFQKFNIILHEDGRLLHIKNEIVADIYMGRERSSHISLKERSRSVILGDENDLPFFYLTIKMSKVLCLWGTPVVCQYITDIEDVESETELLVDSSERKSVKKKKSRASSVRPSAAPPIREPSTMQLTRISRWEDPSENIFRPTLIATLRASTKPKSDERRVPVCNFQLKEKLNHIQIRQLQRYCVPRILSSFKFPIEVKEDFQMQAEKARKPRNVLFRRRSIDVMETVEDQELDFDFEQQHAAERVFPVFHDIEHLVYDDECADFDPDEEKNMFGLVETFDTIAVRYTARHRPIMQQTFGDIKKSKKVVAQPAETRSSTIISKPKSNRGSVLTTIQSSISSPMQSISIQAIDQMPEPIDDVELPSFSESEATIHIEEVEPEKPTVKVVHWTTKHIIDSTFDRESQTMSIKTDRLGVFGFAYKRYEHFPFRDWSMHPNEDNADEIVLNFDTFHARVILYISANGVRGYVTDITKNYVAHPNKYLNITEPINDFRELRRRFLEKNVNIFAEQDASFYIENGYFSIKHMAMEDHVYDAMSLHCKLIKFYRSSWNRLASRRNILMGMKNAKDNSDYTEVTMRITPDNASFVEVTELCSDDLDVIKLDFKNTWRNMGVYSDLHQAINSMYPQATDLRNKDSLLMFNIKRMLNELRVLSFS